VFNELGWFAYFSGLLFLFVITVGLVYEWMKGGLDWD
jgi:NADH-quinone oxidoreductase subunit A